MTKTDNAPTELYKRYRPTSWSGLIGQTSVAKSLRNAVINNKYPVAYLFSGERGCGKTSAARLLAQAANCTNPPKPGDPCGECATCVGIFEGNQIGVQYISMANRGKADDVRNIVDQARLSQPVKKTIWILDEVHNLHPAAWDALLIPFESTSMQSLFILCSTEPHKIPETILSRVQSRTFSLVDETTMKNYMEKIVKKENLDLDDESINAAVRQGRGSVRDTLTALDSIVQTGEYSKPFGNQLLEAIEKLKFSDAVKVIAEFSGTGQKPKHLAEQLFEDLRDILILRSGGTTDLVPTAPVEDANAFTQKVGGMVGLVNILESVGDAISQMSIGSADHRILLEVALLKSMKRSLTLVKKQSAGA